MHYYKTYHRDFDWKFERKNFCDKLKSACKINHWRVRIKQGNIYSFCSSSEQKPTWWQNITNEIPAETKINGYYIKWEFLP